MTQIFTFVTWRLEPFQGDSVSFKSSSPIIFIGHVESLGFPCSKWHITIRNPNQEDDPDIPNFCPDCSLNKIISNIPLTIVGSCINWSAIPTESKAQPLVASSRMSPLDAALTATSLSWPSTAVLWLTFSGISWEIERLSSLTCNRATICSTEGPIRWCKLCALCEDLVNFQPRCCL